MIDRRFLIPAVACAVLAWLVGIPTAWGGGVVLVALATSVAVVGTQAAIAGKAARIGGFATGAISLGVALLPVVFDLGASELFGPVRLALLVTAVVVAAGALFVGRRAGVPFVWRNGVEWLLLAFACWVTVALVAGVSPRLSVLGWYGSYDGWLPNVALVLMAFVTASAFTLRSLQGALVVLFVGIGLPVSTFGLLQVHDRLLGGNWDWVSWGGALTEGDTVWSTMGNPNHLAALIAMLLPIGMALLVTVRDRAARVLIGGVLIVLAGEFFFTRSRGGFAACFLGVLVGIAVLAPDLLRGRFVSRRVLLPLGIVLLAGVVVVTPYAISRVGSLIEGDLTTSQRIEMWSAASEMAADDPLTGVGPEAFNVMFSRYQSKRFVDLFGPAQKPVGPHNVFFARLANEGFPSMLILLSVLAFVGFRVIGAVKRLRVIEGGEARQKAAWGARIHVAGLAAAAVAYLVQASFNVHEIALAAVFWFIVGLALAAALDSGVPITLNPRAVLDVTSTTPLEDPAPRTKRKGAPEAGDLPIAAVRRPVRPRSVTLSGPVTVAIGAFVLVAVWVVARPWMADREFFLGTIEMDRAEQVAADPAESRFQVESAIALFREAHDKNPWEPLYPRSAGRAQYILGINTVESAEEEDRTEGLAALEEARDSYAKAIDLQPNDAYTRSAYAEVLFALAELEDSDSIERQAQTHMRRAIEDNPWETTFSTTLARQLVEQNRVGEALVVLDDALERRPDAADLIELRDSIE